MSVLSEDAAWHRKAALKPSKAKTVQRDLAEPALSPAFPHRVLWVFSTSVTSPVHRTLLPTSPNLSRVHIRDQSPPARARTNDVPAKVQASSPMTHVFVFGVENLA
jgi:hypothetical protein